ncbi:hypothetical protein [Actinomyces sp.]
MGNAMKRRVQVRFTFQASGHFTLFVQFRSALILLAKSAVYQDAGVLKVEAYLEDDWMEEAAGYRLVSASVEMNVASWVEAETLARRLLDDAFTQAGVRLLEQEEPVDAAAKEDLVEANSMFANA